MEFGSRIDLLGLFGALPGTQYHRNGELGLLQWLVQTGRHDDGYTPDLVMGAGR